MANASDIDASRRRMCKALAALGCGVPAIGASSLAMGQDINGSLRVGTWGGSWRDALDKLTGPPLRARGVSMDYVLGSPAHNLAKLMAARGRAMPLDSMEATGDVLKALVDGKFVQKMNLATVPNTASLPALSRGEYYVMTYATMSGIVYNEVKFTELGLPKPRQMSDLINPKLEGRVAFPDVTHSEHYNCVSALAYDAGGNENTPEKAVPLVNKMKPSYFFTSSADLAAKFASGDIWVAAWHAGFAVRLRRTGVPVAFANPVIGSKVGALNPVYYHFVADTTSLKAAEAHLNAYLSPDVQFEFSKAVGAVPMNREARKRLQGDPDAKELMLTDEALNGALAVDFYKTDLAAWRDVWNRQIQR